MKTFALILALSANGVAGMGFAQDKMCMKGGAMYQVAFTGTWTAANHPLAYPGDGPTGPNAHFSPVVVATFGYGDEFWKLGAMASPGVKDVAETGSPMELVQNELEASMAYLDVKTAPLVVLYKPWETTLMEPVKADADHDYLGLITMIAPSPDWFTGASMIELCDKETGMWKEEITYDLMAYDAGTDAGMTFITPDVMEDPFQPISMIACGDANAFCDSGAIEPVATITVTKMM